MATTAPASISDFLGNLGCCWRCSLRFCSNRSAASYRKEPNAETDDKKPKINPCLACVGLVQDFYHKLHLDQIVERIIKADYDAVTFNCTISLPIALMLREHAIWLMLVEEFPNIYKTEVKTEYVTSLKDVWKYINVEDIGEKINKRFELNNSPFQVQINVLWADDEKECKTLFEMNPAMFKLRCKQTRVYRGEIITRNAATTVLSQIDVDTFRTHFQLKVPSSPFHYGNIDCSHASIHIAGRYNKYSRKLSQTPWVINGEKKMETSTQELICEHVEPFFRVKSSKFSSSGREDVDVRMLGDGRPFALELVDPHRTSCSREEALQLQQLINSRTQDIAVNRLQLVSKEHLAGLKDGEEHKTKSYSALCVLLDGAGPLTEEQRASLNLRELVIMQKTPLRVLHRRPLAVRPRVVHTMEAETLVDHPGHFLLRVNTQAGTYVKELVHGDFNRTTPNLCTILGRPVDIVALDVDQVQLDWPPPV